MEDCAGTKLTMPTVSSMLCDEVMQAMLIMRPAVYPSGTNGAGAATMQASRWLAPAMRQGRLMPKMLVEL